jgi:hypothetical protein
MVMGNRGYFVIIKHLRYVYTTCRTRLRHDILLKYMNKNDFYRKQSRTFRALNEVREADAAEKSDSAVKSATDDGGTDTRDYAAEKQKERRGKYREGWINFSVTVPKGCAEFLKDRLESYKRTHPELFDLSADS